MDIYIHMDMDALDRLMSDRDRGLVREARRAVWDRVREEDADTPAGREALHRIARAGELREEAQIDAMCECGCECECEGDDW